MIFTDTHTHLYLDAFSNDQDEVVERAFAQGVKYMLLPNVDRESVGPMLTLCEKYPGNLFPMIGLHPTEVRENFREELINLETVLAKRQFFAIGETGMDLYWDKTFVNEQELALRKQIALAKEYNLPIVLHSRDSFDEIFEIIDDTIDKNLRGVFHCFGGTAEQAEKIISWGFKLGIGGVLTYKNSGLDKVITDVPMEYILLETDAPYLAPNPYRGKRNESVYLRLIAEKLSEIKKIPVNDIARITTQNAVELFNFPT